MEADRADLEPPVVEVIIALDAPVAIAIGVEPPVVVGYLVALLPLAL